MDSPRRSLAPAAPLLIGAAAFTLAGGYVHLREWLDTYRDIPASVQGSALVRVGFPINAGASLLLAIALVLVAVRPVRRSALVVAAAVAFQAGSLATLIGTRVGTVVGWSEPIWTRGAEQTRAVEIGALVLLALAVLVRVRGRRSSPRHAVATA